ncbi:autotransporter adhesin/predicted nucleic acid-binding Zn-ribbon protein [Lysobacter sp. OAE881]|uniref:ESPR-type extended signal peptide-containing protein n=1 Tax=Lysobacter sp. OAE881 TaxID=2663813 RepID=UPI00178A1E05
MNKIYRIVFNAVTGRWVVASELATGRKKQGGGERVAVAAVLVTGVLGSLMGAAHAGVVVNGDPQEATASCELITDSGTTTWTASTNAGACLAPVLAGSASGQGNPGADAVFYASNKTNGSEDSLNLGGYLDTWKTATFHGGIAMDGQKITGLANGTAATDAATFGQLNDATHLFRATSAGADPTVLTGESIAIGGGSQAGLSGFGVYSANIAVGSNSIAGGGNSIALGTGAKAGAKAPYPNTSDLIAIGANAQAEYGHSIAIGGNAKLDLASNGSNGFGYAVGIGDSTTVTQGGGTALGATSSVTALNATALGVGAVASTANGVALGANSVADRGNAVSVGSTSTKRQIINVADGTVATDAATVGQLTSAMRHFHVNSALSDSTAGGIDSTAIGPQASTTSVASNSVAIGPAAKVEGIQSVALGRQATVSADDSFAVGYQANIGAGAMNSLAIGRSAVVTSNATTSGFAIGTGAKVDASDSIAFGRDSYTAGTDSLAIGRKASVASGAINSIAIGMGARVTTNATTSGFAIGTGAMADATDTVAFGRDSTATAANSLALGHASVADRGMTVSVGKAGFERQVVNMAKGTADTDAVNVAQLKGVTGAIGGGAAVNADGTIKAPSYALSNANTIAGTTGAAADVGAGFAKVDSALGKVNTTVAQNATDIAGNTSSITSLQTTVNNISNGTTGLVQQSAAGANLTVGKGTDGAAVDFADKNGTARKLLKVAAGTVSSGSTDAVNGGQLYTTNQNVAQNTADISSLGGRVTTAEGNISTINTNVTTLGGRVTTAEGNITNLQNTVNNISSGTTGLVQQSAAGANLTVGKGTDGAAVDFADKNGSARKLLKVAAGTVASGSTDAVNGGQLYTTNQAVAQNTAAISTLDGRVTTNEGDISTLKTDVTNIDGRVSTAEGNITQLDNRVTTNEGDISTLKTDVTNNTNSISTLNTSVSNIDSRVTNVEGSVSTITNQLNTGEIGLVKQDTTTRVITVAKDADGAVVDIKGTAGARRLTGVADGTIAAGSKDAVNGGQLDATNQVVAQNVADIADLDGRVSTNEGDITTLKTDVTNIDGRVTSNESSIATLDTNVSNIDSRVTNVEGSVSTITNQLNSGEIGLVQYDDAAGIVTVAKDKAGAAVDFRGSAGARRLKGVAAGGEDEDAVNVSQLKKMADAIGGGATVNADGSITAPTYYVTNADGSKSAVTNMGDAMSNIDGRVYNNTTQIQSISTQISSGTIGMVQQAGAGQKLTVGKDTDGSEVDFADKNGNARKLTNVADGKVEAGSKDAVNGGQLHAVSQSMASALGGGSVVNADGTVTAPTYTVTNADGSSSQVSGVEGAVSNLDNRVYQNTTAITNNTAAINTLSTQISNGEVGLVKQDAATRQITVAKDSDGTSVSVAGTAGDRVVTGVAAAKADNDAVNLGQLKSAGIIAANGEAKSVITYDSGDKSSITMGGEGATTAVTIHNVADGVADHDAVNVSQLNQRLQQNTTEVLVQANSYTDQKLGDVWTGMDKLSNEMAKQDGRISSQGAMSMAEAQMASGAAAAAVGNPNGAWSVGLGSEQGHGAISAGYAKPVGRKSQISFGAAFGGDDHSVGVGFAHKL